MQASERLDVLSPASPIVLTDPTPGHAWRGGPATGRLAPTQRNWDSPGCARACHGRHVDSPLGTNSLVLRYIFVGIYTFHMPLFFMLARPYGSKID